MARKSNTRAAQGTGTIRKKTVTHNGKEYTFWEARYTAGRDPGTGKQIQRSITGKTQKEVAQKLKAATAAIDAGTYHEPSKITVGGVVGHMGGNLPRRRKAVHSAQLYPAHQEPPETRPWCGQAGGIEAADYSELL